VTPLSRRLLGLACSAVPARFQLANALGPAGVRCVLFHDVASSATPFTRGLDVTVAPESFERCIAFLARNYQPVDLDALLAGAERLPARPVLVTFDDAYASVARTAAPILARHRVPALFFVNAAFLDGRELAVDNLLSYVAEAKGLGPLQAAARAVDPAAPAFRDLPGLILGWLPGLSSEALERYTRALLAETGLDSGALARTPGLYASRDEIRALASGGLVEIASHTRTHRFGRSLRGAELERETAGNASELEAITGRPVRAFSIPYGSSRDLGPELLAALARAGNRATFVVEGRPNPQPLPLGRIDRVSLRGQRGGETFLEIEVLPRLRAWRGRPVAAGYQ